MTDMAKEVPIESLSLEQLGYVGKQVEQEVNSYSSYYTSLKVALNKFTDNKEYIRDLQTYQEKDILVPITSSLYIPGKCKDVTRLTVEIGANFFVETNMNKADSFCDRKIATIKKNMDRIDEIIKTKTNQLNLINHHIINKQQAGQVKK